MMTNSAAAHVPVVTPGSERHCSVTSVNESILWFDAHVLKARPIASCSSLPEKVRQRASHGISEDQRTLQAKEALKAKDYAQVGHLMVQSHQSLRDQYEVSCKELDALVDIAMGVEGVYGSRMTGGGFGGCTITLLKRQALPRLLHAIETQYPKRCAGKRATCFATGCAHGAMVLQLEEGVMPAAAAPPATARGFCVRSGLVGALAAAALAAAAVQLLRR